MTHMRLAAAALLTMLSATARAQTCPGDCNGDGTVTVDEIVLAVNIALGVQQVSQCTNADRDQSGMVEVDEIIQAVNAALCGCGGCPTPTPTPFSPTATATPGLDIAAAVQSAAFSTIPGATAIAAFIIAPGSVARELGAGGGGPEPCPAGGTVSSFCFNTGATSSLTADLTNCGIQRSSVEYRATGRITALQPITCGGTLPPNSSVTVDFRFAIVTTSQSGGSVNGSASMSGDLRFRTDGSISSGLAGGGLTPCGQVITGVPVTFLVTPMGSLCPTSGDLRVTLIGTNGATTTSLVRYSGQGGSIDVGDDGTIESSNVLCGPPSLVCH